MDMEIARIIVKQIANDVAKEMIAMSIETEFDWDRHSEEVVEKVLNSHYDIKFKNLTWG